MSAISTILTRLRAAIWAIDVRDDIANAIEQCYSDVSNPTLKTEALEAALQNKIDEGEMAALTIGDHTITAAKLAQGVIDNTLATSGAAADAKKTGDEIAAVKADLDAQAESMNESLGAMTIKSSETLTFVQGNIDSSTGGTSNSYKDKRLRTGYYVCSEDKRQEVVIPNGYEAYIYCYSDNSVESYISAYLMEWKRGSFTLTDLPQGTNYVRFALRNTGNTAIIPDDVTTAEYTTYENTDTSLTMAGKSADAGAVGMALEEKFNVADVPKLNEFLQENVIDISNYPNKKGSITQDNTWLYYSSYSHRMIPIPSNTQIIDIVSNATRDAVIAVLASNSTWVTGDTPDFSEEFLERIIISPNTHLTIAVPDDGKFLYVYMGSSAEYLNAPEYIKTYSTIYNLQGLRLALDAIKRDTDADADSGDLVRDIPKSQGVRNAYKKAMQLASVSYVTKGIIKRTNINDTRNIPAGGHTGIIYSGTADKAHYVGYNVSLLSYMTAINNPYSAMYTEEVSEQYSTSKYGVSYHGANAGAPLGVVCASYIAYCLGLSIKWENHAMPYLASIGIVEKIADQSATGVQLMDVLYKTGHVALITDIYRDSRGEPQRIRITESVSPFVKTTWYSQAEFNSRMGNVYTIYRYVNPEPNLDYTPSPFVAVDTETHDVGYEYNDDICTYMGDKAVYVYGDLIVINYGDGEYGNMIIESTALANPITITLNPTVDEHCINLSSYNLQPGDYTAKLEIGSGYSEPTYFKIVDLPISVSEDGDSITVTFDKTKDPAYMQVNNISGGARCVIPLTDADIAAGQKTFDIRSGIEAQDSSVTGACYMTVLYHVTDPAGYKLTRSSAFVPLEWTE